MLMKLFLCFKYIYMNQFYKTKCGLIVCATALMLQIKALYFWNSLYTALVITILSYSNTHKFVIFLYNTILFFKCFSITMFNNRLCVEFYGFWILFTSISRKYYANNTCCLYYENELCGKPHVFSVHRCEL